MRGLKLNKSNSDCANAWSHLLQMRGLKHFGRLDLIGKGDVASFTDAWIETLEAHFNDAPDYVASFTDAWIETGGCGLQCTLDTVASFTDAWIETVDVAYMVAYNSSRIFYRCVD